MFGKGKLFFFKNGGGEHRSLPRKRLPLAQVPGSMFEASRLHYNPASRHPKHLGQTERRADKRISKMSKGSPVAGSYRTGSLGHYSESNLEISK